MDSKDLKKILAGLSIAGLLAGAGLTVSGCATSGGNGDKSGASSATEKKHPGTSG